MAIQYIGINRAQQLKDVPTGTSTTSKKIEIGVRPEDIRIVQDSPLRGEVYVVEPMGNETLVDVRFGEQRMTLRAPKGFTAAIGSPLGVSFDAADACFFDSTGSTKVHRARNKGGQQ